MISSRTCTKCGLTKPLEEFSKAPRGKYGRKSSCKECDAARHKAQHVPKPRKPRRAPFTGEEVKTCTRCGEQATLEYFSLARKATATANAVYRPECKQCQSDRAMEWFRQNPERTSASKRRLNLLTYGLTVEEYDAMVESQGGVCAICRKPPRGTHARDQRLVVDHCHTSGLNRGLLCNTCNRAIGLLGDDVELLYNAISYLTAHTKGGIF
jgi:hypothetical protein